MPRLLTATAVLLALAASLGLAPPVRAQEPTAAPPHFSKTTLKQGRSLFHGAGACAQCHGENGPGTPDGPSLTAGPWALGDGSYSWLLHMTRHAGWGATGRDGDPQRMRGPTALDPEQIRRVTAYVFSISRAKTPAPSPGSP
jgi:mono/diheme cytochrome c family protein